MLTMSFPTCRGSGAGSSLSTSGLGKSFPRGRSGRLASFKSTLVAMLDMYHAFHNVTLGEEPR